MDDTAPVIDDLKKINRLINDGENGGIAQTLQPLLCTGEVDGAASAPLLAFRRANGKCVGAKAFLGKLKHGGDRKIIGEIEVRLLGRHRAVVTCVIETGGKQYHNLRLFVRSEPSGHEWKLLAWANEEV